MKRILKILIIFSIVFLIGSCSDPIFYTVFRETPILKPYIDGSPTNFAVFNNSLYVASGKKIFVYKDSWSEWKKLSDRIGALAATTSSLYALYFENDSGNGRILNLNLNRTLNLSNVQSIHAIEDVLFVSVRTSANNASTVSYIVYYKKDTDTDYTGNIGLKKTDSSLLGVASIGNNYYLCTISGIYRVDHTFGPSALIQEPNGEFTGMINLNDNYAVAIARDGKIYEIYERDDAGTITTIINKINSDFSNNRESTGALAVWYRNPDDSNPTLLLAGRKEISFSTSSGYTNGYVEITLDTSTGAISGSSFNEPGSNSPSSIDDNDRYLSSLGKEIVNHIIQTPASIDPKMRLLASTQQNGVWSYRDRGEGLRWNSEQR